MANQTHRLKTEYTEEELQDSSLFRWIVQVYKCGLIGQWVTSGKGNEWVATHPYTAIAQALIGDKLRKPLQILSSEMVSVNRVDEPNRIYWLSALDIMIIADEIATLVSTIGEI